MPFKDYRKKIGLTQEKLAERLGVDQTTIAKWETGKSKPRADVLIKLSKLFNCSIDELLK